MQIKLTWSRPIQFKDIFKGSGNVDNYRCPGVYLWTEFDGAGVMANYIGRALGSPDLVTRQQQHYLDMISGRSMIPAEYRSSNRLWTPGEDGVFADVVLDNEAYKNLVDDAFNYLNSINVRLCRLPDKDRETIAQIEKNLIYQHQPWCNTQGKYTKPDTVIELQNDGDWPL